MRNSQLTAAGLTSNDSLILTELGAILLFLGIISFIAFKLSISSVPLFLVVGLVFGNGGFLPLDLSGAFLNIGAQIGAPGSTVVCLTGDGGLQFSLAELGSAADIGASVIFIVWNNNGYQEIETSMVEAGIKPVGVTPSSPDFVAVANAYGIEASRPKSLEEFIQALKTARDGKAPYLICLDESVAEGTARS